MVAVVMMRMVMDAGGRNREVTMLQMGGFIGADDDDGDGKATRHRHHRRHS